MMTRRDFVKTTGLGMGAMACAQRMAARGSFSARPNIIYILADQLRYQSCGYAGDARARTPNLDRLAAEGASFHQAVSSMPVCSAYRASLLTGNPGYAMTLERFQTQIIEKMASLNDTFPESTWYRDHWIEDRIIKRTTTKG